MLPSHPFQHPLLFILATTASVLTYLRRHKILAKIAAEIPSLARKMKRTITGGTHRAFHFLDTRSTGRSTLEAKAKATCLTRLCYDKNRRVNLDGEFLCERKTTSYAEGLQGDLQSWRRLLAFVFVLVHAEGDAAD